MLVYPTNINILKQISLNDGENKVKIIMTEITKTFELRETKINEDHDTSKEKILRKVHMT